MSILHRGRGALLAASLSVLAVHAAAGQRSTSTDFRAYTADSARPALRVTVRQGAGAPGHRDFDLASTAPARDHDPQHRTIHESSGAPFLASGNALVDALFAMSVDDARLASVETIRDGAYNDGAPIPCHCFETGEQWHYVWTRDLAYALDLGLAGLDPARAVASLTFKTSRFRAGVTPPPELPDSSSQIIQDTGSGGSWPVSTDRTAWALGAEQTLAVLDDQARAAFSRRVYQALRGTVEADRLAAYDARDGLYGGEQSFLDWREQTYAPWIVDDLASMAQSKALSTNVTQLRALRLAARLARTQGDVAVAARYAAWSDTLGHTIDQRFWLADRGLYASIATADATPALVEKFDLLGNMLAIVSGVATEAKARRILSRYPFAPFGPPVVWPQAPGEYVYHNRALWPFVTAYALRAAAQAGHVEAADRALSSLVRGAALHLSNMENLEWLTGQSRFDDGPAINSRRQLWSIGAYYGAVVGTIFGWRAEHDGVRIAPFLTTRTRALFGATDSVRLAGLLYQGKPVEIVLSLPPRAPEGGVYAVRAVHLNGTRVLGPITTAQLSAAANRVEVTFGAARAGRDSVTLVAAVSPHSHDDPRVFMPRTPTIAAADRLAGDSGRPALSLTAPFQRSPVAYRVFRDGRRVADGITGSRWVDPAPAPSVTTVCYSAVAVEATTGLASHPSARLCARGSAAQTIEATDERISGGTLMHPDSGQRRPTRRLSLGDRLVVSGIIIRAAGEYAIAAQYDNHVYQLNTGITNAVKRLVVVDAAGARRQIAVVQMPHVRSVDGQHPIRGSTRAYVRLSPGTYSLELSDFFNMSAVAANASYSGPGGKSGMVNEARIAAITIDGVPER